MICDNCGKSNISDLSECSYCGAKMPNIKFCAGFTDILTVDGLKKSTPNSKEPIISSVTQYMERTNEQDMQKLLKKSDNIIYSTKKSILLVLIAIALSLLILITSVIIGCITIHSVKDYKDEVISQITEINQKLEEYKLDIDAINPFNKTDNDIYIKTPSNSAEQDNTVLNEAETEDEEVEYPSAPHMDSEGNIIN